MRKSQVGRKLVLSWSQVERKNAFKIAGESLDDKPSRTLGFAFADLSRRLSALDFSAARCYNRVANLRGMKAGFPNGSRRLRLESFAPGVSISFCGIQLARNTE